MRRWAWISLFSLLLLPTAAVFAMTSTNYQINWDSMNSGGEDTSTSTNFQLRDTIGEMATGLGASQNYQLSAGYRVGDTQDPYLSLTINTQETPTKVAWTAFSNGSKTVTVASAASFSVGQFIGVVENSGASQLVAFGKITNIAGTTVTVDAWEGAPGSISTNASGGDDFAYRLNGSSAALGASMTNQVATSLTITDVVSNGQNGYTVSVQADGGLRNAGGLSINDVSDGSVTAGSEEYGAATVGTTAVGTGGDFSFPTTSTRNIQRSTTYGSDDRSGVIYKLSTKQSTPTGNYGQTLYYRLTSNF
jgi:hypothetical protein